MALYQRVCVVLCPENMSWNIKIFLSWKNVYSVRAWGHAALCWFPLRFALVQAPVNLTTDPLCVLSAAWPTDLHTQWPTDTVCVCVVAAERYDPEADDDDGVKVSSV